MNNGRNTTGGRACDHRLVRKPTALAGTVTVTALQSVTSDWRKAAPIGVRIEASTRVCAVAPHKLDHWYH